MLQPQLSSINQTQRERLFHIDFKLYFLGTVSRNDIVSRFGIKEAAATRDISLYKDTDKSVIIQYTICYHKSNLCFRRSTDTA